MFVCAGSDVVASNSAAAASQQSDYDNNDDDDDDSVGTSSSRHHDDPSDPVDKMITDAVRQRATAGHNTDVVAFSLRRPDRLKPAKNSGDYRTTLYEPIIEEEMA